jgi:hypothetical protein
MPLPHITEQRKYESLSLKSMQALIDNNTYIIYAKKNTDPVFYRNLVNFTREGISLMMRDIEQKQRTRKEKILTVCLILHLSGGPAMIAEHMRRWFTNQRYVTFKAYVPAYAASGGTAIALMCDEVHCNRHATFSPIDTQIQEMLAIRRYSIHNLKVAVSNAFSWMYRPIQIEDSLSHAVASTDIITNELLKERYLNTLVEFHTDRTENTDLAKMNWGMVESLLYYNRAGHSAVILGEDLLAMGFAITYGVPDNIEEMFDRCYIATRGFSRICRM